MRSQSKVYLPRIFIQLIQRTHVQLFVSDFSFLINNSVGTLSAVHSKQFGKERSVEESLGHCQLHLEGLTD